ncbi:hypothetical protein BASA81_015359 [Batrachochytrium salamandrivorans]|nr:hypothetical protein BASA81_015359 [Batrachochytrium salamandrivorans]
MSVVELVPRGGLVIPNVGEESLESRRRVVNNKLLDLAIKQCQTTTLKVLLHSSESRQVLSQLYNDIWDGQLVHGKAKSLDVQVVFDSATLNNNHHVWFMAPITIFPTSASSNGVKGEVLDVDLEANTDLVLYDNPLDVARFIHAHVALGGTFDQLHAGHKKLLTVALESATQSVTVGVTSDAMLQTKKNANKIERLEIRLGRVREFCESIRRPGVDLIIVPIDDPFGPTVTVRNLDALVCSSETLVGANMVNAERQKIGFPALLPIVTMRSNAYVLSSTFLRERL